MQALCKLKPFLSTIFTVRTTTQFNNSKMASTKPFTIVVEGNVGVGKTTFLEHCGKREDFLTLTEPVELWRDVRGHNLFDLMYNDPKGWGFMFQTYVQLTMTQLHEMQTDKPVKLMERSLFSARYCFVENLVQQNVLDKPHTVVLDEWFKFLISRENVTCDLIVYLRAAPETVYKRMQERSRPEERGVTFDYVKRIHDLHEAWLFDRTAFSLPAPVLIMNADNALTGMVDEYRRCEQYIAAAV